MAWSHTVTAWRADVTSHWSDVVERGRAVIDRFSRTALWIFFAALSATRFPALFHNAQFYAEEGNVYFGYAANHGVIDSLFERHIGYFSLVANVAGVVSTWVPLAQAVLVTRVIGLVGPVVCAWVIISSPTRRVLRLVALGVVVFTFTMTTEWATTIHAQFWLAVAVILMLAVDPDGRRSEVGQYVLVTVAGLSGVLACVAAPAYALRWFRRRGRRDAVVAGILSTALAIQFFTGSSRDPSWHAGEFVVVAFLKLAFYPFTGVRGEEVGVGWYESWSSTSTAVVFAVLVAAWMSWVGWVSRGRWRLVTVTSLATGLLGLFFAIAPYSGLAFAYLGTRYSVAGVVPVLIALVMSWGVHPTITRLLVVVVVALAIVRGADTGFDVAQDQFDRVPVWEPGVEEFRDDPGDTLPMDEVCRVSVNGDEQRDGFDVEANVLDDGGIDFDITPGQFDTDVPVQAYVISLEPLEVLTPQGWQPLGGFLYGEAIARCHQPDGPVEPIDEATGPFDIEVSAAEVDSLADRSDSMLVGYGRSFPDALAKGTLDGFRICALRPDLCPT